MRDDDAMNLYMPSLTRRPHVVQYYEVIFFSRSPGTLYAWLLYLCGFAGAATHQTRWRRMMLLYYEADARRQGTKSHAW